MPSVTLRVADAMRQTGYLPDASTELGKAVKTKLVAILASPGLKSFDREPIPVPSVNVNIWLSVPQFEKAGSLAGNTSMSEGGVLSALLLRDFEAWKKSSMEKAKAETLTAREAKKRALHDALASRERTMRHEQRRMLAALDRLIEDPADESRVMFLEAGTGIGKTLGYLGQAIDVIRDDPAAFVVVAVPSFALIRQVRSELAAFPSRPDAVFLAGQNEWVSASALKGFLFESAHRLPDGEASRLESWMNEQSNPLPTDSLLPPRWSRESLLSAVPEFRFVDDITISDRDSDEDPGFLAYKRQFADLGKTRLAIMTHAMLATLLKRRFIQHYKAARGDDKRGLDEVIQSWEDENKHIPYRERNQQLFEAIHAALDDVEIPEGMDLIPLIDFLVIDEAHQFEDAVSNAFSTYVSLRNTVKDVRDLAARYPNVFPSAAVSEIARIEELARTLGKQADQDSVKDLDLGDKLGIFTQLSDALADLFRARKGAGKALVSEAHNTPIARRLRGIVQSMRVLAAMHERMGASAGSAVYLHWSPQRDYPRLTMGRVSLEREFHYLWTVLVHRTALVSGTLYEHTPSLSYETARRGLAVPPKIALGMEPIHADWQIKPVTLYMIAEGVDPANRPRFECDSESASVAFVRPASKMEAEKRRSMREHWLDDVARYTRMVYTTSAGGVLVLGTAFADLEDLAKRLLEHGIDPLVHRSGIDLAGLKLEFIQRKAAGGKPILLAAGAAWTGFDLHTPDDPDLLTDLVIINAPLGIITKTISRLRRASQKGAGHFEVAYQALKMVRQAFGRLVRTELPPEHHNRRIHWLDARIHDPSMVGLMAPIRRFMARYRTIQSSG